MIVPARLERLARHDHLAGTLPAHHANARERDAFERLRHGRAWRRGEEQFVILAAVERLLKRGAAPDGRCTNLRAQAGGLL